MREITIRPDHRDADAKRAVDHIIAQGRALRAVDPAWVAQGATIRGTAT